MKRALPFAAVALAACGTSVDVTPGTGGAGTSSSSSSASSSSTTTSSSSSASSSSGAGGTGGMGGAGGTGGTGGAPMICPDFGDACTSCAATACPDIWCACRNNIECLKLSGCYQTCSGDTACEQDCQTQHPDGIADLFQLSDCAGTSCPTECPKSKPLSPCVTCVLDTCPDALSACLADPECVGLYQCLSACAKADLVCQQGCYAQHGAGVMNLQALLDCEITPCGASCM